jgi:hypothetical protein
MHPTNIPRATLDLELENLFKYKHKVVINISNSPKIMINSEKVNLCRLRLYFEAGHKNIFIFCLKNLLGRSNINTR